MVLCSFEVPMEDHSLKLGRFLRQLPCRLRIYIEDAKDTARYWGKESDVLYVDSRQDGVLAAEDLKLAAFKNSIRALPASERRSRLRSYYLGREIAARIARCEAQIACRQEELRLEQVEAEVEELLLQREWAAEIRAKREAEQCALEGCAAAEMEAATVSIAQQVCEMLCTPEERMKNFLETYPEEYRALIQDAFNAYPDVAQLALSDNYRVLLSIDENSGKVRFGHIEKLALA